MIELVATRDPGSRVRELLALSDEELTRALRRRRRDPARGEAEEAPISAQRLHERLGAAELWSTCRHRPAYPAGLRELGDQAPAALFGRGDAGLLARLEPGPAVAIVGARRASTYGRTIGAELGRQLAGADAIVVSGLANGVDAAAHEGALAGSGKTIAVLGAGAERSYPRGQRRLYERIVAGGVVLSELPPGTRPYRWTFPARNRIMAALAQMTVVVEAALRSGSLITAEMALDLGREVGAVPGPVNAGRHEGANRLLVDGAHVLRDAQDVLDVLCGPGARRVAERGPELSADATSVLSRIEAGERPDAIALALVASPSRVATALTELERLGYIDCDLFGRYRRTALRCP